MTGDRILLAHGGGGRLMRELIERTLAPALDNPYLASLSDAAILPELPPGRLLIRNICMAFDRYLRAQKQQRFSRVI